MDGSIRAFTADAREINIDINMAQRFMRIKKGMADAVTQELFAQCESEILSAMSCKSSFRRFDITAHDSTVDFGSFSLNSEQLCKNLYGCNSAVVFTATLGSSVDRLIAKYSRIKPSAGAVCDAIASAAIEGFCDYLCASIENEYKTVLRPRFSPGYGDLDITAQKLLLTVCDSMRQCGVTLTDTLMMTPMKSVSAIVGVSDDENIPQKHRKCSDCSKKDCAFRIEETT